MHSGNCNVLEMLVNCIRSSVEKWHQQIGKQMGAKKESMWIKENGEGSKEKGEK